MKNTSKHELFTEGMGQIELKGLGKYRFEITDNGLVVTHVRLGHKLKGQAAAHSQRVYMLTCDDGKLRRYGENVLMYYCKNPQLPALCNNFLGYGVRFSADGQPLAEPKNHRRYDVFESIDDALETVMLVRAYQHGDVGPMLVWMKDARPRAVDAVTKFGKCGRKRAEECLEGGEDRFLKQLETFNVRRIMPLFAMLCKCLKVEIMNRLQILIYKDNLSTGINRNKLE